jgi:hypothetical protein
MSMRMVRGQQGGLRAHAGLSLPGRAQETMQTCLRGKGTGGSCGGL